MADKTSDAIKLNLRLPKPLHRRLRQQAKRNNVTAKRMAEAMKPLVEEAIDMATARREVEIKLAMILEDGVVVPRAPRTEVELEELLRKMATPADEAAKLLQMFREIQAGTRVLSSRSPWAWEKPEKK
jgi:uncharacterized heparinase superfamily protein